MKSYYLRKEDVIRQWWIVDLEGLVLGRAASVVARVLMGKHRPYYQPDVDCGDFVIAINASKIVVTGKKLEQKVYSFHTNYPGGLKQRTLGWMLEQAPERVFELAVKRMLPKNRIGKRMLSRLKVYAGSEHPHEAQQPALLEVRW
ncbi:MAG: 50S ribosomal protein L13 [Aquificaceae bacterium]|nr:50S ribosomal protein L13 [Aquificaceae bacterium]